MCVCVYLYVAHTNFVTNSCGMLGCHWLTKSVRLQQSHLVAAAIDDTTALPNKYSGGKFSGSDSSDPALIQKPKKNGKIEEEGDNARHLDDQKMIKVCDKLIEVFMVDKTTPTDWRRLLAFSKEWDNIRPHFYKRCHDRADIEYDPGMKHKLLRLGRKLKEVSNAMILTVWSVIGSLEVFHSSSIFFSFSGIRITLSLCPILDITWVVHFLLHDTKQLPQSD